MTHDDDYATDAKSVLRPPERPARPESYVSPERDWFATPGVWAAIAHLERNRPRLTPVQVGCALHSPCEPEGRPAEFIRSALPDSWPDDLPF